MSKRIAENGPPLRGLIVDPFVRSPMEDKLRARGVDPAAIRIHTGYEDDPQIILATELWARSLSNTVAAFVPSGSGAGNPIIAEVMLLVIASVAIKGALKNPDRPVDVKMTVARPKAPPKVAP